MSSFLIILVLSNLPRSVAQSQTDQNASTESFYTEQFRLEKNTVRYYVTALNQSETWTVNVTSVYHGIFHLFIYDSRPQQNYVSSNGSVNTIAFSEAKTYNITYININSSVMVNETVHYNELTYTANATKLYYLMIALVDGTAPDTYILQSNSKIQAYFIPFIDGYPFEFTICVLIGSVLIIHKKIFKKTFTKISN
jgi:hypothetical protein